MNLQKLRNMAGTTLVAFGLFAGSVAPVAAAPQAQVVIGTVEAHPFECEFNGNYYPIGTKLGAGPLFYRQCEWGWVNYGGHVRLEPVWKIYPRT